jgi:hypothetical protein
MPLTNRTTTAFSTPTHWIDALDIEWEVGLASVSESLHPRRHELAYGSADKDSGLSPENQEFLDQV